VDKLSTFFTLMAAMSIAAERVVEIIKGIFPSLAATDPDANKERRRHMVLQFLAALAGIIVAAAAHVQVNSSLGNFLNSDYDAWSLPGMGLMTVKYLIIGVMVSGGSAMWNHALDIVGALKTVEEKKVA
jgi:hypothetical protein